jgi:hypothetical protein
MEELLAAMQVEVSDQMSEEVTDSEEELLALSEAADTRIQGKKTMRIQGTIGN